MPVHPAIKDTLISIFYKSDNLSAVPITDFFLYIFFSSAGVGVNRSYAQILGSTNFSVFLYKKTKSNFFFFFSHFPRFLPKKTIGPGILSGKKS